MNAKPEECARPAWTDDNLDSPFPPEIKAPYFDERLGAWVFSRYADVIAAFHCPGLSPVGATNRDGEAAPEETARLKIRAETKAALSLRHLHKWQKMLAPRVSALARSLPTDRAVDLVSEFARPLCLTLAMDVTGADPKDAERLDELARRISSAAADPYDPEIRLRAKAANACLRDCFHAIPETLRKSGFVALSQTVPCLLANVWFAFMEHPEQWSRLHHRPGLTPQAMEELLRYAGLTRLLFRRVLEDMDLNGIHLRKGDRIILRITAANKDPMRFPHPDAMDFTRRNAGQLAFGAGPHACVGANLVRMAAITLTRPLLECFAGAEIIGPVEWRGGPIFRVPASLPVRLRKEPE